MGTSRCFPWRLLLVSLVAAAVVTALFAVRLDDVAVPEATAAAAVSVPVLGRGLMSSVSTTASFVRTPEDWSVDELLHRWRALNSQEEAVDCSVDPCLTWGSTSFRNEGVLNASGYEASRKSLPGERPTPLPNVYRCRDASEPSPCRSPDRRGATLWYRHRHRFRGQWTDPFEFDGSGGLYNDYGTSPRNLTALTYSASLPVAGRWSPSRGTWCSSSQPRVLVTGEIKKGYGLTNRLLSLAGLLAFAGRYGSAAAVDASKKVRIPIHKLLDLSSSKFPSDLDIVLYCNYTAPLVLTKRLAPHNIQTIDRKQVALRPHKVMHLFDTQFALIPRDVKIVFMHELYLRYPFEQERDVRFHASSLLCGFRFARQLTEAALNVIRKIRQVAVTKERRLTSDDDAASHRRSTAGKFAAWHLRMETADSVAMRKRRQPTSPDAVAEFVREHLAKVLREASIRVVVVCSGTLPSGVEDALRRVGETLGVRFLNKSQFLGDDVVLDDFGTLGSVREREGEQWIQPTPTDGAAIDAVIMEHADVAFVTTTSSFSALVYARRCGGNVPWRRDVGKSSSSSVEVDEHQRAPPQSATHPLSVRDAVLDAKLRGCHLIGNVYLYDTYLDGTLTGLLPYPCGFQFGPYLVAPPAQILRPPPELDVFAFRFLPTSPLFVESHRNVLRGETTPIPLEQP